jgi:hypothetical protein
VYMKNRGPDGPLSEYPAAEAATESALRRVGV